MATPADSQGIVRLQESDPLTPASVPFNMVLQNVSDALKTRSFYPVANAAERNSLASSLNPTVNTPLLVYRADSLSTRKFEYTFNGVDWYVFNASKATTWSDTGIVYNAGFYGFTDGGRFKVEWRVQSGTVFLVGSFAKTSTWTAGASVGTLPLDIRPSRQIPGVETYVYPSGVFTGQASIPTVPANVPVNIFASWPYEGSL